jgi:serine protease inhibitor
MRILQMASVFRSARAIAVALVVVGASVSPPRAEPARPHLSIDLLARLVQKNATQNVMVSPYSLTAVLAMLEIGAAGETRMKLRAALGIKGDEEAMRYRERQRAVLEELRISEPRVLLQTANGIWNSPHLPINAAYVAAARAEFDAEPLTADFTQPSALASINDWVRQKTDGAIPVLVAELPADTLLVLANALHFRAKWAVPFDPAETKEAVFRRDDGTTRPASLMSRKDKYSYHEGKAGQAVRLAYADDRFVMTLFLPAEKNGGPSLTPALVAALLRPALYAEREGTLSFPRLRFDTLLRLADLLGEIRLSELFGKAANYQGISSGSFRLTQVIQRIAVNVDESGTEAAAATAGLAERGLGGPVPFTMICDRSFYFIIDDKKTDAVLFVAHIGDPAP